MWCYMWFGYQKVIGKVWYSLCLWLTCVLAYVLYGPKAPEIGKGRSPDRGLDLVFK